MGRESREVWEKRVARWRESGLSAREFAAEVGIKAGTLGWWSSRLRQGGPGEGATGPHRPRKERTARTAPAASTAPPVKWVEVVGVEGHTVQRDGAAAPMPVFELVVAGRTIRVPAGFDAESLRRLLAVVEAR